MTDIDVLVDVSQAAVAAEVLDGPLGVGTGRIVIEVASSRQKYGRLAAFYADHPFFAFEEGLLASYAQSAAAARVVTPIFV